MTQAEITNAGGLYIVSAYVLEKRGNYERYSWQAVDSTPFQNQAIDLKYYTQRHNFESVKEIFQTIYYEEWSLEQINLKQALKRQK